MKLKNVLVLFIIFILSVQLSSCSQRKQSPSEEQNQEEGGTKGYLIFLNAEASDKNVLYRMDLKEKKKEKITERNMSSAAASDSKVAFLSKDDDGKQALYMINGDGSSEVTVMNDTFINDNSLSWSPDSRRIAYTAKLPSDDGIEVYHVEAGKYKTPIRVTGDSFVNESPRFSNDGREIFYAKNSGNNYDIYKFDTATGEGRNLSNNDANDLSPTLSFDGTKVFFLSDEAERGKYDLYCMDVEGGGRTRLTTGLSIQKDSISISPDNSMIAFITLGDKGSKAVHVIDMKKATVMVSSGGYLTAWSKDSKILYFASTNQDKRRIVEYDVGSRTMSDVVGIEIKPGEEAEGIRLLYFTDKLK